MKNNIPNPARIGPAIETIGYQPRPRIIRTLAQARTVNEGFNIGRAQVMNIQTKDAQGRIVMLKNPAPSMPITVNKIRSAMGVLPSV